ncbi:hypothetical protein FFLO_01192 [Filobasidium floriforme]|uniref:Peptidase A1 domain-containing protein n=1 Tax=Filobasidium floriforme TaxID=5210 RepID=A0A8K0JR46_9TREE|nr:aspartic peptidase domain-containing protein [Filobasidium floriforme]KAG7567066.1 hypothetical protein FFLO_01192 [Filobasidium floriforme]KAH8078276.1 aspartic peptidase domain-containing protein [Filobasidium floriforme]
MLIDTGSADTWIGNKDCKNCRVTLSSDDSSTFKLGTKNFDITYGLGYAAMTSATDKFGIAGMFVDQFDFGSAHTVDDQFANPATPFVGILGTAQGVLTAQGVRNLPERLMDTGVIPNAVVAYALGRVADGENTGQLTIGGYDAGKMNAATTQILDVADKSGFWNTRMGAVMVDGDVAVQEGRVVILDTGTTLMYLPPADADAIHLLIEGAAP